MALIDYAQKRQEKVWARSQSALGVYASVLKTDAVKIRGSANIPSVMSDFVVSEEVRDTPDTDQFIKRKKPPGQFELTCYAKVPTTKGRLPQWGVFARDSYGKEQMVLTVLDYAGIIAQGVAATITLTIDGGASHGGSVTVLTNGTQFTAATSNAVTATSIASAINAISGLSAVADGAEVLITRDDGFGEYALTSTIVEADMSKGVVRYTMISDNLEIAFTLVHGTHNAVHSYRDCKVSSIDVNANGGDEATLVFKGFLGNEVYAAQTHLAESAGIEIGSPPRTSSDRITFNLETAALQIGPTDADTVLIQIGDEVILIDQWDPDTKLASGFGCQLGTSAAAHAFGDEVLPYQPGTDPDANDSIIPLTLGEFALDSVAYRVVSIVATKDERLNARMDEAFLAFLTGYRRPLEGRTVEGTVVAYQRLSILELQTYGEREKEAVMTVRLGREDGPRIIITCPHFRIGKVEKGEAGGEFTRSFPFQGLASSTPGNDGISMTVYQ